MRRLVGTFLCGQNGAENSENESTFGRFSGVGRLLILGAPIQLPKTGGELREGATVWAIVRDRYVATQLAVSVLVGAAEYRLTWSAVARLSR
jgi:hypothetical protein